MARPKVSILFPVRNASPFLSEALNSMLRQSFRDFEILAVDDGSSDGSLEHLQRVATADTRIRILKSDHGGIVRALEVAREAAAAPYLARMDADDVSPPDRLARQFEFMERNPAIVLCGTTVKFFPRDLLKDGTIRYESWVNSLGDPASIERDLFVECPVPHPTFFMRAQEVEEVGGYRDRGWPEDYDLLFRLWLRGARFGKVAGEPFLWRDHPARLSRMDQRYWLQAFRRLKVTVLLDRFIRPSGAGARDVLIWGAGPTGKAFSKLLQGAAVTVRAFVDLDPAKIGQTIHGAPVVGPAQLRGFTGAFCLGAVAQPGAREEIRAALNRAQWVELEDYAMVA